MGLALAGLLAGCAKPPPKQADLTTQGLPQANVQAVTDQAMPPPLVPGDNTVTTVASETALATLDPIETGALGPSKLAGRTLYVGSAADLKKLKPGEVILTFDDGPDPGVTPKILKTLKAYGVKATFFMVGKMAKAHPETAQLVAASGNTIGSHSHGHENLKAIGLEAALNSVSKADDEIAAAIKPTGKTLAPFFRFPYMAETRALRADLIGSGLVIFGLDVDSWDYLNQTPERIMKRTLRRLEAKGSGIILFHDIHARTAKMLPDFLDELQKRGYKVVRVVPKSKVLFDFQTLLAAG